jgi:hypothetical protein
MLKGYLSNQKGMALAMVLIVMVVLSLLGVVILQICVAESNFTARDNKSKQAYYLAKSGVEATTAWMLDNSNNGALLVGKTSDETELRSDINGTFKVKVDGDLASPELLIIGTGTVDGISASAAMILKKAVTGSAPVFEYDLYAENIVLLNGHATIEGDIGAGVEVVDHGHPTIIGDPPAEGVILDLPPPIFPADPSTASSITYNSGNVTYNFEDQPFIFKELNLQSGNPILTVNTGSDPDNEVNLVVEKLYLRSGTLKITGAGKLNIFVTMEADFNTDTNYNDPLPSDPKQLMVYLAETATANVNGNRKFNGLIYGPGATVTLGGNGGFTGAIIAGDIIASGTPFAGNVIDLEDIIFDDLPVFNYDNGSWVRP